MRFGQKVGFALGKQTFLDIGADACSAPQNLTNQIPLHIPASEFIAKPQASESEIKTLVF